MTAEEMFDRACASATQDRRALVRFLASVSVAQAQWHPPDGEWSILEGLEHLMLTEAFFRANLLTVVGQAEASGTWDNSPLQPTKMSAAALRRRAQGFVAAPDVLLPHGNGNLDAMRTALLPDRDATRDALLPYRARDLSRLLLPHPRYGERNVYDVIEYAGIHDALHQEQMQRVTCQPGYPQYEAR